MTMVRKQIYIGEDDDEYLKRLARELRMTEAAVIRYLLKSDSMRRGKKRNEDADKLMDLMLKRAAQLPNGGSTVKFDRESLYDR
jgi:hypothetical protein